MKLALAVLSAVGVRVLRWFFMKKIAFVGLGNMGFPMAGHLINKDYTVTVYNRTASVAERWVEQYGGESRLTPAAAAEGAEVVITCVGNDNDLQAVVQGRDGVFSAMQSGCILLDHTTASAEKARELASLAAAKGFAFLDAPVSGGQLGAEQGALTAMVGGEADVFERVESVLSCYAKTVRLMGPVGAGQLTKMVNQICVAGLLQGLAEGLHFAEQAGLDVEAVMQVVSQGAASSWQMQNRYQSMLDREFDFGFAVKWMRKDLRYVLDEARKQGAQLPVTALVDQFYADIEAMGGANWDTSSLIQRLQCR